ncbi:MAG TPA: SDR family NAD(P)-dependent oxidoreductase [Candidatus Saccharimonadales bacterium]|nr:SDR family NAD(P)-dependent oxidoreductase [Candidatus Saccharimonadales bacterium]
MSEPAATDATTDPFRFDGRVVFVAGAGAFGRAAAPVFAARGAAIFVTDLDPAAVQTTVDAVRATGGEIEGLAADTGDPEAVRRAFDALDARFGRIDVLLNVSGGNPKVGPAVDVDLAAWNEVIRIDLTAKLLTSQAAARRMIAAGRGGSIVNISSIAGSSVLGRETLAYGTAMGGVIQLTRELAIAWAPHGIRVNAIQPCQFVNPGLQSMIDDPDQAAIVARIVSGIPLGRMGRPDEMVGPLVFLASDAASMVTGVTLPVDGGNLAFNAGGSAATR